MFNRFSPLFAALSLAISLHATDAAAALNVTATQASGARGQDVDVILTIGGDGLADEANLSAISAYTFNFLWDAAVLNFNGLSSSVVLAAPTVSTGSAVIDWFDGSFFSPVNFSGGVSITANFHIRSDAAYGATTIDFGDSLSSSALMDDVGGYFSFSGVTQGSPMQVTVTQPASVVPEPAEVSMLLAGLGVMASVVRRRRNRRA
jgi:hypothetical protein